MNSNWLPEIVKRSESGPFMKEADFDMAIAKRVPELIQEFGLTYDPNVLVPSDDDLANRVFQAGLELFLEMGAYNMSTQRRALFTRDEVEEAVALAPKDFTLGEGKDAAATEGFHVGGIENSKTDTVEADQAALGADPDIAVPPLQNRLDRVLR